MRLIKLFEGYSNKAYLDPIGIPTIGYGSTFYPNGQKVKVGDTCTPEQADEYLQHELNKIKASLNLPLNQNQTDAVLSFIYNVGIGAFNASTLKRKIKANPNDPTIRGEFLRWNKAGGKVLPGLVRRRKAEADLYFS